MRSVAGALRRKVQTFKAIRRSDGPAVAFKVALFSARNSFVYWVGRLLEALHLRAATPPPAWRAIEASATRISVVTPVYNTPPDVLRLCIESVLAQEHTAWELCVCDDCSTRADTVRVLTQYRGSDPRIRIVTSDAQLGISGATNLAAEQATGEFIALLDHDDELHPQALAEIADAARRYDDLDLLYTDEDKIEPGGEHSEPFLKPDWSPDYLHSVMYVLHCLTIRKALFWQLGGLRSRFDGSQDYDLVLRASRVARRIHHVPRILYHWRKVPGSAAAEVDAKPAALLAARGALAEHAASLAPGATVEDGFLPGTFRLRRPLDPPPQVTLVVLTADPVASLGERHDLRLLPNLLSGIEERTTYPDPRILVVHDGALSPESERAVSACGGKAVVYADPLRAEHGFSFARKADLEVVSPGWLEALIEPLTDPQVGVVGARLVYPDSRLQHAGIVVGVNGGAAHVFHGMPGDYVGHGASTHVIRNYSAVTAAVFATRRSTFQELGGFDEVFAHDYQDVDFCLRARRRGYRIVYTPFAELVHYESASLKRAVQDPGEVALFRERWADVMERDPYYNPSLPRDRVDYEP
jgi:GT2 family glycosyltransferase